MSDDKIVDFPQKEFAEDLNEAIGMHMSNGALDLAALENTPAIAINGGLKCDVVSGPCSCGAWHEKGEDRNWTPAFIGHCRMKGKEPGE